MAGMLATLKSPPPNSQEASTINQVARRRLQSTTGDLLFGSFSSKRKMIKNTQAPERRVEEEDGSYLQVHSIFGTIQGEGPYSGHRANFIRLAGCNLQCSGCDTIYTGPLTRRMSIVEINGEMMYFHCRQFREAELVVITGGEPFRQNITPLCHHLIHQGHTVQVETNGTLPRSPRLPKQVKIVVSPKAGKVNEDIIWAGSSLIAYKYVLDEKNVDEHDGLPTSVLGSKHPPARPHTTYNGPIYISPMDAGDVGINKRNIQAAVRTCMTHGYILNLQVHKLVRLP